MSVKRTPVSPVPPVPRLSPQPGASRDTSKAKVADPDRVLFNSNLVEAEIIPALFLEDIGAQELSILSRHDLVNGQSLTYRPIRNLQNLSARYGPKSMVLLQGSSDTFFNNFPIKLQDKVPEQGLGPFGEIVYIEDSTNNLVINVHNIAPDEQVEVQILVAGSVLDDTIYPYNNEEDQP
jgi:hypothetical protein